MHDHVFHFYRSQIGVVVLGGYINHAFDCGGRCGQRNVDPVAFIAIFFPMVQVLEHVVIHQVCHTATNGKVRWHKSYYPPWSFRCTAVIV
jgi:hypothetical protein